MYNICFAKSFLTFCSVISNQISYKNKIKILNQVIIGVGFSNKKFDLKFRFRGKKHEY